ncbi:MAG: hypothetical protein WCE79_26670 [Xanthobacteraceae bacterium]
MTESSKFALALLGAVGAWAATPTIAQDTPPDAVKIAPGVYTTPEISAKCRPMPRDT